MLKCSVILLSNMISYNYCKWLCAWRVFETDWEFTLNVLQLWEPVSSSLPLSALHFCHIDSMSNFPVSYILFCYSEPLFPSARILSPSQCFFVINFLTFIPACVLTGSCHILSRILALFTWSKREMQLACLSQNYKHYISFWCNNK